MDHLGQLWVLATYWFVAIFILGDRTRYRARLVMLVDFPAIGKPLREVIRRP